MITRRLIALLSAVSMLHLSVVAGDAACAAHGAMGSPSAGASAPMIGHQMSAHDVAAVDGGMDMTAGPAAHAAFGSQLHTTTVVRAPMPPCETPVQPQCCETMAGCSVTGTVASRVALSQTSPDAVLAVEALAAAPTSVLTAPEPPPPKA